MTRMATKEQAIEFLKSHGWHKETFVELVNLELPSENDDVVFYQMSKATFMADHIRETEGWTNDEYAIPPLDFDDLDDINNALEWQCDDWEARCDTNGWDTEVKECGS